MTDFSTPLLVWGHLLAAVLYAGLAVAWWRRGLPGIAGRGLLLATVATAVWALSAAAGGSVRLIAYLADVARYAGWFLFLVGLFRASGAAAPVWLRRLAFALPVLSLVALVVVPVTPVPWFVSLMLLPVVGLVLVEQVLRNLPEDALWSAKPIGLALVGTFAFDVFLFSQSTLFQGLDADVVSVRGLAHAAVTPLLMLTSARHRDWIAKIRVSRQVVFHSAALLLVGGYLLFMAGVGYYVRYFGSDWGRALQLALMFVALLALAAVVLSRSLRARLRVLLGKHFFSYRYDYREEWLKFTRTLSAQTEPQALGINVVRGLADMVESPSGALWLHRPGETSYRQVACWNMPHNAETEPHDSPLLAFIQRTSWVVSLPELVRWPQRYDHLPLPDWLKATPAAWVVVPLWLGQDLLGFVVLGRPRTSLDLNWEVTDLLKTAGRQAASFLGQMQATEALLDARKFEAFSRMSAFVVHDLKNIVTQLSLMMKNAKRLAHNPEFQADMLMTVENSLERMRQLMLQLREGASPSGTAVGVDLERIATAIADSVRRRGRHLELELQAHVSTRGHEERLERVMGHLVNNALDATQPDQRVWLKVERYGSHARVEVGDQGVGMSKAFVQERLFKPFQTTKSAGMGIGAYESFQYVQELGGKVQVDSEEGRGTVVTLLLPLIETYATSDLHPLGEV